MKKRTGILGFLMIFVAAFFSTMYAQIQENSREIHIAGIIIDSKTKQPVMGATIVDENNNVIASTDDKGYFFSKLNKSEKGEIDFRFTVKKKGYTKLTQIEHWADQKNPGAIYYLGIKNKWRINDDSFSKMLPVKNDLVNYDTIAERFIKNENL
ncbi:carboxypeptidase-like regulatory domain-containing protein [Chryseobacterium sp. ISL-6]|uniref:carboxypeptidase-like regulatory domain-containing protein n=1 Tax=Chryseobacterium sp. ISL-6 TaxID=2819143 RepID=UPI001BE5E40A|nr:carboxypeptidase-like regulatory domain-containing protein [Chryseobacterium sp. ISL-6]MBT2620880.1 hypothetical protein [Chryseobacterium sp. ISL-6]